MWKMDLIHNYNGKTIKLNKIDHELVGTWLHKNQFTIKYDYKLKGWRIAQSINKTKFLELIKCVGSNEEKLNKLMGE